MKDASLVYEPDRSVLLNKSKYGDSGDKWVKKINNTSSVAGIIEDGEMYYIACDLGETSGQFLALRKESGSTEWFIPGRSFLHLIFDGFLYLIFIDENEMYYLLKVNRENGKKVWHHPVGSDLKEYKFAVTGIELIYHSGKKELISVKTGKVY
jgi:outer membrane protein assembly factor BamB